MTLPERIERFGNNPIRHGSRGKADWNAANETVPSIISQTSTKIVLEIGSIPFNGAGYVAVRAIDNVGNAGLVSASIPYAIILETYLSGQTRKDICIPS